MARDPKATARALRAKAQAEGTTREEADALQRKAGEFDDAYDRAVRAQAVSMPALPGARGPWGPSLQQYQAARREIDAERASEPVQARVEVIRDTAGPQQAEPDSGPQLEAGPAPDPETDCEPELEAG